MYAGAFRDAAAVATTVCGARFAGANGRDDLGPVIDLHYTPFVLPLALSAAFCVAMLVVAWRNRVEPVAPWFAATVLTLLAWSVGYMLELMATGLQAKITWANLQYIATVALPVFWLQVVLMYVRRRGLSRHMWIALGGLGALVLAGVFFNPGRLFRGAPELVTRGSLTALHPDYGPLWSFGWVPFVYGLLLVAGAALVRATMRERRFRLRQSLALLAASLLPLAAGTVYALGLSPWPDYNPAMAVVSVSAVLMAYALFSSHLFELTPLARSAVIEHLADGVLILDRQGRLVDANPAARVAFPNLAAGRLGQPLTARRAAHGSLERALCDALVEVSANSATSTPGLLRRSRCAAAEGESAPNASTACSPRRCATAQAHPSGSPWSCATSPSGSSFSTRRSVWRRPTA